MPKRPLTLEDLDLPAGKKTRLHRLLYKYGPGNGRLMILPIDQGLEHGPRDFFVNPESLNPEFQLRLALEGGFSAIAFQVGLAEKYLRAFAGKVPLILKINGKTEIPPDDEAFSPCNASVEDAVRLGADAVGYTCYIGSPRQDDDFVQFGQVRRAAERSGLPLIMWAYPRGKFMEQKGGRDSLYAVDYAARVAQELGADVVKVNYPKVDEEKRALYPKEYRDLKLSKRELLEKVVASAGRTLTLMSGGSKRSDEELFDDVKVALEAGVTGFIFGRNMWQRRFGEALEVAAKITKMTQDVSRPVPSGKAALV
ncbi:MAG: fructose-bisphosphate aldolase [Candidatus Omnitrophica bacterium]|nr:fructose-bisphosphate aldolase [Candidatus Omnitrophota bacterium]MBI3083317.1 fructose-bisphosphate aldolase [Candidatus Omnitrophota bacterium]